MTEVDTCLSYRPAFTALLGQYHYPKTYRFSDLPRRLVSWLVLVAQLYLTLCDPKDCSPPGSSVRGVLQARILEWVSSSGDLPDPGIEPESLAFQTGTLLSETSENTENIISERGN